MKFESIFLPGVDVKRPLVIAGPCSAETEEQVLVTAKQLAAAGVKIFRAGVWKPRTKPGGFEGVGSPALEWLKRVKLETDMYVTTEVATEKHVDEVLKYGVDLLWVGARTTANPFAVQEIADALKGVDIPVFIKNPVNPDIELWVGGIERFYNAGVKQIGLIHRGFSSSDMAVYRNLPQWHIPIEMKRRFPSLPMLCDPSHMGGQRDMILKLSQQAMDLNYSGLMIEVHCCPDEAWSDKEQQITSDALKKVLNDLVIRDTMQTTESLATLRDQIDDLDNGTTIYSPIGQVMESAWICRAISSSACWRQSTPNQSDSRWWSWKRRKRGRNEARQTDEGSPHGGAGRRSTSSPGYSVYTRIIFTSLTGRSCASTGSAAILSITSSPSTTSPNTV